jgi:hypothetical protein
MQGEAEQNEGQEDADVKKIKKEDHMAGKQMTR